MIVSSTLMMLNVMKMCASGQMNPDILDDVIICKQSCARFSLVSSISKPY